MNRPAAPVLCLFLASVAGAAPAGAKDHPVLLDVQATAAPVPALKYQLLPEVAEMNPGNAVPAYLKCFAEQNNFFFSKESVEEREKLLGCPLTDIKPGSLKGYGGFALRQADHAARLEFCDWNILPQIREHGYMLLIPEIQQMRTLANALAARCRGQIVDHDFDGAVHSLQTMFALSRHLGEHPTVISGLVGLAIAHIAINRVEEFVQQPGAPNLYWALTGLPNPVVDTRKGVSADRLGLDAMFGYLLDAKRAWSPDDLGVAVQKMKELASMMEMSADERKQYDAWIQERIKDEPWMAAARKGLADGGSPAEVVAKYPPLQVIFYHLYRKSRVFHDEAVKWVPVPYWQAVEPLAELEKVPADLEEKMTRQTVFAVAKVKVSHARVEQRLALVRAAEALRLHGAGHDGKLPETLSELGVPVPADPVSGKPFEYKRDGLTAVLCGKEIGTMKYAYEVRLRK